jgi:hypothetical protein
MEILTHCSAAEGVVAMVLEERIPEKLLMELIVTGLGLVHIDMLRHSAVKFA